MKNTTMIGTEGTGEYTKTAIDTTAGAIGYRQYAAGYFRIRVEPKTAESAQQLAQTLTREDGWKQPKDNGKFRFSKTCRETELNCVLDKALAAVAGQDHETEGVHEWAAKSLHRILVAKTRQLKVPGCAGAKRWHLATLRAKVKEFGSAK